MKYSVLGCLAAQLLLAISPASALRPGQNTRQRIPPLRAQDANRQLVSEDRLATSRVADDEPKIVAATFDQLLDHGNPGLGTFKQRYWYNTEFYNGPGSPVVLVAPTEENGEYYTGFITNLTVMGTFAQAVGGAAVLLEHRYWGESSPYQNLTAETLQYLTLDNALDDLIYFARNVSFLFDPEGESKPDKAPWVLSGCSYAGALSAWIQALAPGTFWSYHCTSATVEVIDDLWQYYAVIEEAMPRNCSADVQRVMRHVDGTLASGDEDKKRKLKRRFGLEELSDYDFATGIEGALSDEQYQLYNAGYGSFHQFCDYVENRWPGSEFPQPGEEGVGLCAALEGYAKWFREIRFPGSCAQYPYWTKKDEIACYVSDDNSPFYTDTSLNNAINRQWEWMLCNEPFKWWRVALPADQPHLISNLSTPDHLNRQCHLVFPPTNGHVVGIDRGRTTAMINEKTGGWLNVNTTRLMWATGGLDPWKPATVSSRYRPGGPLESTPEAPVRVMPNGVHCADLSLHQAKGSEEAMQVIRDQVQNMKEWVGDFYKEKGKEWPGMPEN